MTATTQRGRMLRAVLGAVAEKGYARMTVADVVARAGVSRRTFYEHFRDKEDCFLAAYEAATEIVIAGILDALRQRPDDDWRTRVRIALDTYTGALAAEPQFARALLIDVLGAGPRAVELRQRVYDRFVAQWRVLADDAREEDPSLGPIDDLVLRALVGGIGELTQRQVLTEGAAALPRLAPVLAELGVRVFEGAGVAARPA